MAYSEQMNRAIARLRRRIHDVDPDDERFTSEGLYEYIQDAVDELEMYDYKKGIYVDDGDFLRVGTNSPVTISREDMVIYVLKAQILLKLSLKDQADRDNFALRKNNLSVDTTRQSSDHGDSLDRLEKDLQNMIYRSIKITGVRVE